jgi:signal transduction histidine kinase
MSPTAGASRAVGSLGREADDAIAQTCHKLRTPLTAAHGFVQLALREAKRGGNGSADQLEMIDEQLRRMAAMLDELAARADHQR